ARALCGGPPPPRGPTGRGQAALPAGQPDGVPGGRHFSRPPTGNRRLGAQYPRRPEAPMSSLTYESVVTEMARPEGKKALLLVMEGLGGYRTAERGSELTE